MYHAPQVLIRHLRRAAYPAVALLCGLLLLPNAFAQRSQTSQPSTRPAIVDYQHGVRINWRDRQVEVQGQVVLREGALELFACSPHTREHESIVCIDARPLHVFQALGLIGINPGQPSLYNPDTREYQPAAGDPVEIEVDYVLEGRNRREPIERWLRRSRQGEKPGTGSDVQPLPWVFAGSFTGEEGTFAADPEGTVISLVDFGSSLIALPEYHSDSNAELWLEPATERIPPVKTPCTLIFRSGPVNLNLDSAGRVRFSGRTLTLVEATRALRELYGDNPGIRFRLVISPQCPADRESAFLSIVHLLKIPREAISIVRENTPAPASHDPKALADWVREHTSPTGNAASTRPAWNEAAEKVTTDLTTRLRILQARTEDLAEYLRQLSSGLGTVVAPNSAPAAHFE
jgi:hypothetical protein